MSPTITQLSQELAMLGALSCPAPNTMTQIPATNSIPPVAAAPSLTDQARLDTAILETLHLPALPFRPASLIQAAKFQTGESSDFSNKRATEAQPSISKAQPTSLQMWAGVASALIVSLPRFFAYIPNVLKGSISHSRVGWGIFTANGLLHTVAMLAAGESYAALNGLGFFASASIVSLLCWKKGTSHTKLVEKICAVGSAGGLATYGLFKAGVMSNSISPEAIQLTCASLATLVSLMGCWSQFSRYIAPATPSQLTSKKPSFMDTQMAMLPWTCSALAASCTLFAMNIHKLATLIQPCSLITMAVFMCWGAAHDLKKRANL